MGLLDRVRAMLGRAQDTPAEPGGAEAPAEPPAEERTPPHSDAPADEPVTPPEEDEPRGGDRPAD